MALSNKNSSSTSLHPDLNGPLLGTLVVKVIPALWAAFFHWSIVFETMSYRRSSIRSIRKNSTIGNFRQKRGVCQFSNPLEILDMKWTGRLLMLRRILFQTSYLSYTKLKVMIYSRTWSLGCLLRTCQHLKEPEKRAMARIQSSNLKPPRSLNRGKLHNLNA